MNSYNDYHKNRGNKIYQMNTGIPAYIKDILPADHHARILDIGCGNGQFLYSLRMNGYVNLEGLDLDKDAVAWVRRNGINCRCMDAMQFFPEQKFDFISMNHVLEHLPKEAIIPFVENIRKNLLNAGGTFLVRVPNAQSNTDCYWMYEDFTHNTLFTAGSLEYVLKCAGFTDVCFLDEDGLAGSEGNTRKIREKLLYIYKKKIDFWNWVTGSSYHKASKRIYTWELKAVAREVK